MLKAHGSFGLRSEKKTEREEDIHEITQGHALKAKDMVFSHDLSMQLHPNT